jgi:hypothetical protein
MTPPDPGIVKEVTHSISKIVDIFTRPFEVVSKAVADRLERWLKRKPKLFVRFHPQTTLWCLASSGEQKGMQLIFMADFTQDGDDESLLLIDGYVKGTKPWVKNPSDPITIKPGELVRSQYINGIFVSPVVGEPGKNWTGRIIFLDQFHTKYKTDGSYRKSGDEEGELNSHAPPRKASGRNVSADYASSRKLRDFLDSWNARS